MNKGEQWQPLMKLALSCLDSLANFNVPPPYWTFGGGTRLMLRYRHRLSREVDIFLRDVQSLNFLTPRLNETIDALTKNYEESGSAPVVKLTFPEGEVDFIVARQLTDLPPSEETLLGRKIALDHPLEVVAKKAFLRYDEFKIRDVFDTAIVLSDPEYREDILRNRYFFLHRLDFLRPQIERWANDPILWEKMARTSIDLFPAGEPFLGRSPGILLDRLAALEKVAKEPGERKEKPRNL